MKTKDFFTLMVKLFGLYSLIISVFSLLPQSISLVAIGWESKWYILVLLTGILLTILMYYLFIRNANIIVEFLKIDRGFEKDEIDFSQFKEDAIVKVAFIILGGILLIESLPAFIGETLRAINVDSNYDVFKTADYPFWLLHFIKLILSLGLIFYYRRIQLFLFNRKSES